MRLHSEYIYGIQQLDMTIVIGEGRRINALDSWTTLPAPINALNPWTTLPTFINARNPRENPAHTQWRQSRGTVGHCPPRFPNNINVIGFIDLVFNMYMHIKLQLHFSTWIDFNRGCWQEAFGMKSQKSLFLCHKNFCPPPQEIRELTLLPTPINALDSWKTPPTPINSLDPWTTPPTPMDRRDNTAHTLNNTKFYLQILSVCALIRL